AAVFQSLLIGVLAVLVVYPFVHRSLDLRLRYQAALIVLGVATIAYCYWRYVGFRRFITWTSPAPLVFALVFLFFSPVQGLLADRRHPAPGVEVGSPTPVVLSVSDESPLSPVPAEPGRINGDRSPTVPGLARQSTWYPHATTVHHHSR